MKKRSVKKYLLKINLLFTVLLIVVNSILFVISNGDKAWFASANVYAALFILFVYYFCLSSMYKDKLADLKKELNLAMVFISHDIQTVRQVSDRIVVMYGGQILETGSTEDIFNHPTVDYTRKLLGVAPSLL